MATSNVNVVPEDEWIVSENHTPNDDFISLGKRKVSSHEAQPIYTTFAHLSELNYDSSQLSGEVNQTKQTMKLTKSGSAWLEIEHLSDELKQFSNDHYTQLFNLHPKEKGKVMMNTHNNVYELKSSRWHQSYLNTPKRNTDCYGSYMFCGKDDSTINTPLPELFTPFHEHINKLKSRTYNQVVANWYQKGSDYLAFHSDYTQSMVENYNIVSISLNDPAADKDSKCRTLTFKPKGSNRIGQENDTLYSKIHIVQNHGIIVTMCGDTQVKFTHGVKKMSEVTVNKKAPSQDKVHSRINLSFREYNV